jgi:hypothetical protein
VITPHLNCLVAFKALEKARDAFAAYVARLEKLTRGYQKTHDAGTPVARERWEKLADEEARHRDQLAAVEYALDRANATLKRDRRGASEAKAALYSQYAKAITALGAEIEGLRSRLAGARAEVERLRESRRG